MTNQTKPVIFDTVDLCRSLINRPSITPHDAGAMDIVEQSLTVLGFDCTRLRFGEIENLYARRGLSGPNLCFAGHTDVVPTGLIDHWQSDPFAAEIQNGILTGRGAVDMKGAIAAWIAAVSRLPLDLPISLSFLITGDEEGDALNGTTKVVDWLRQKGETIDHCLVGEPTAVSRLGDMIKVGRRGSINTTFVVTGKQGHVAYPHRALNPAPIIVDLLNRLKSRVLDEGYERFQPSNLEITNIEIGNRATNIIPQSAAARINIRFNPCHRGIDLAQWMIDEAAQLAKETGAQIDVTPLISGEAFLTQSHDFIDLISQAIGQKLGIETECSTTGGTSDARFIRHLCPVVEFGLVGQTMHMVNECVAVEDLFALSATYEALILGYASRAS